MLSRLPCGPPWLAAAALSALIAALPTPAAANGVFPNAGQIAVDPTDPQHVVIRTTYGILTTREGGAPWDWICESAVGYGSGYHPAIALTANGTLVAGLADGLGLASADTCGWSKVSGALDGLFVVDVSVEKSDLSRVVLITSGSAASAGQLWTSDDNAATWVKTGANLPAGFEPLTIDVAPSDPMRVYVTAQIGNGNTKKGTLFVSDNRGDTWSQFSVPNTDIDHAPYIAGVDPLDPDRLFVRNDGVPGRLFLFDRAAGTFTPIFTGAGILRGFALSPDGATLLVGGSSDGIWRAPTDTLDFEKRSSVATRCLTWTAAGVYSCATEFADGFTVGLSTDEGATFEPVMHLPCVRGPLECGPETVVGAQCPAEWPAVALQIDASTCDTGSGGGGASGSGSGSGAGTNTGGDNTGGSGAAGGGNGPGPGGNGSGPGSGAQNGGNTEPPSDMGCACSLARTSIALSPPRKTPSTSPQDRGSEPPRGPSPSAGALASLALTLLVFRRGRRRATERA